ncbi:DUF5333 domain-containing protein [Aestuariivita sp.]|jgi:hypothetical protein|uniref:DUF5333 domain-containing protein n=1 Tax=Aestuariivita sp. TaxID=1872407 RepID=UPI00216C55AD|nr:DUF5333 domain-containing protein [Aestuariivita sp.]MCE8008825.1 DUF5333 domain-containing protein [Aestuariivita sp.]
MIGLFKPVAIAATLCLAVSSVAAAKPPLREVAQVDDGLFQVAVANVIRKRCDSIDGRLFKAIGVMQDIKNHALSLGYSDAEIDAYVDSRAEKDRMIARGAALFEARGVNPDNPDDLCRMGREEIAKKSAIGALLRAR